MLDPLKNWIPKGSALLWLYSLQSGQQSTIQDDKKKKFDSLPATKVLGAAKHLVIVFPLCHIQRLSWRGIRCPGHINQLTSMRSSSNSILRYPLIAELLVLSQQAHRRSREPLFGLLCMWSPLRVMFHHHFNPSSFPQDHPLLPSYPVPMVNRDAQREKGSWSSQQRLILITFNCFYTSVSFCQCLTVFDIIVLQR